MKSLDDVDGSTLYIFITFLLELEQKNPDDTSSKHCREIMWSGPPERKFSSGPASIALL